MTKLRSGLWMVASVAMAVAASANTLDELLVELKGADEAARAHARQLLPREGVDALPSLIPLINHESEPVWRATWNVVADIANQASAPGREADRKHVTDLLTQWLAPSQSARAQEYGLRLLQYILPSDYPVDSISPFLANEALREYARGALELIDSEPARVALEQAYGPAEPAFKLAILDSLRKMGHEASLPLLIQAMDDPDAGVRAAAARAAAQFGDPAAGPHFLQVQAGATPETMFDATDAVLRYADALASAGGNWALAMATYIQVLANVEDPVLVCGAMMGLGRFGDEHVVPVLLEKARTSPSREVQATLPMALAALDGFAATTAILSQYAAIPDESRPLVLRAIGTQSAPEAVALVVRELQNPDARYRRAALDSATHQTAMELMAPLMALMEEGDESERGVALSAALAIARAGSQAGSTGDAGSALVRLYGHAPDDATRIEILNALAKNPVSDALPLAKEALGTPALANAAVGTLVALMKPLSAEGKQETVREIFGLVTQVNGSAEYIVAMAAQMGDAGKDLDLPRLLGAVRAWHLIGPFAWKEDSDWERAFVNEPAVDLVHPVGSLVWKESSASDAFGTINLIEQIGQHDRVFAYAYTTIEVAKGGEAQLRMGSDDGIAAWVNGEKVWENRVDRGMAVDSDVAPIQLKDGTNTILLKISQGGGGWNFCCRVSDMAGLGVALR